MTISSIQRTQNRVEHLVELLSSILGKESQHEAAVLLQWPILASVPAIRFRIREVLRTVQFDRDTCLGT